jgi:gamma-glutamyltranspeptidase/glutathione hydrolase
MTAGALYHHYIEAVALAFADRNAYVGDPGQVDVPLRTLLSDRFAAERACSLNPVTAAKKPVPAGDVTSYDGACTPAARAQQQPPADTENRETTNLTVVDRWGNIVEYTLTIEQTGGSGIVVPGRGFLLNNELTDFSAVYDPADPNRIEPLKRPRSSMSPTIVLKGRRPWLALGSPGGSTIITTVLQILLERVDRGLTIAQAVAAPRASNRNLPPKKGVSESIAEQAFIDKYGTALQAFNQTLTPAGAPGTSAAEIGAATAIEIGRHGRLTAVAEPTRRGGGSALVVKRRR